MEMNETSVPYPYLYRFLIFNTTKRKHHKGGKVFKTAKIADDAKLYKSRTLAEKTVRGFQDEDTYVIVDYIARAVSIEGVTDHDE